ncbi:MAG: (deoxy)nucleoside triphosphate pyrophosphohydrolase [Actinobacteria bacterium]|nr:(deoxy)nucleoside triphosphate pyrophosphohydrolase [Actinomycetota bacterium]
MKKTKVTAAVISRRGKVLIARRRDKDRHPGKWEFPGGKVEKGESLEDCMAREIAEEMGVTVRVGEKLALVGHRYDDIEIELVVFNCEILEGEIKNRGCSSHAWVSPECLLEFDLLPPDREIASMLY